MIRKHFHDVVFDGKPLSELGVHVSGTVVFNSPEKEYESVRVPGKHGDLLIDTGTFKNINVKYPAFIMDDFKLNFSKMFNFMMSRDGYCRLEDSYHPDEYRKAIYKGPIEPEIVMLQAGTFDLEFNCKPERYLKIGDIPKTLTATGTIVNPTYFNSFPLLRIYGNGTLTLPTGYVTISGNTYAYLDLDCTTLDAFYSGNNLNSKITIYENSKKGLTLKPDDNVFTFGSGITQVIVWPRWWKI